MTGTTAMLTARLSIALFMLLIHTAVVATPATSPPLTLELRDHRPIPPDLIPALINARNIGGLAGGIRGFSSGQNPQQWHGTLVAMHAVTTNTFTTTAPVDRTNLWLLIDHPGYLRLFSTQIPSASDHRTTVVITIPERGELRAKLNLISLRPEADSEERWQKVLKDYCFDAAISPNGRFSYDINYKHPLKNWEFLIPDIAPGNYRLFATGRWCESRSGPAGYGTVVKFAVQPATSASFKAPIFRRRAMPEHDEPVEADVTYRPLAQDRLNPVSQTKVRP
jgi:hypothetical protein